MYNMLIYYELFVNVIEGQLLLHAKCMQHVLMLTFFLPEENCGIENIDSLF